MESEHAGATKVFWLANDVETDAGKGVLKAALDEMVWEMRDIDADPAAVQFLRGMDGGAAAAKRIENEIAFVRGGGDDAFEQGERLLGGVAEAFLSASDLMSFQSF